MSPLKIVSRYDPSRVLYEADAETLKGLVVNAVQKKNALSGANLSGANLSGANLSGAYLSGANLSGANLSGAYLSWANLSWANLSGANLSWANLSGANLSGANLSGANLSGANLSGAYLSWANLSWANLSWANLSGANLSGANLSGAKYNWQSHDLIAETLVRAAGDDLSKRMIAGLVLVSRDWCWDRFLALDLPDKDWAMRTLAKAIVEGDGHPGALDAYRADTKTEVPQ